MINWAADTTNDEEFGNSDLQWKVTVRKIEEKLRKLKQDTDKMVQKINLVKTNPGSFEGYQMWSHNITDLCNEITGHMGDLLKMMPKDQNSSSYSSKKMEMKQLSERVQQQIKSAKNLSSDMQKDMERSYKAKRMSASLIANPFGTETSRLNNDYQPGYQMSAMQDPQLQQAIEEQQQCEKLANDINKIEGIMAKISEMVHEQGEIVDNIESNVIEALDNTDQGIAHLEQAVESHRSAKKKKLCIILIVIGILAGIGLIIGLSIKYG